MTRAACGCHIHRRANLIGLDSIEGGLDLNIESRSAHGLEGLAVDVNRSVLELAVHADPVTNESLTTPEGYGEILRQD